ncbi:MAG: hypothetical protein GFH27_549281n296 [Chloroflexi bacterium AL-W]|nr:hypothetical protein [Chloroflexi bacterium AL-N1]NOK66181.1 hypothetical protein [Chloroflexi bacterium AL-N10]NOK73062.1 hypothetical protein [Chloroflexi bacterium AL-N5]NOK79959.1 hypothetical protein [Chloroflexi bacterium AL-W]NOK88185.1 hypothetical protein [Chloroflexi bacterium AL-N15]
MPDRVWYWYMLETFDHGREYHGEVPCHRKDRGFYDIC